MKIPKKRSGFEDRVSVVLEDSGFEYEPLKLSYFTTSTYTPDWAMGNVLVEAKGWFRPGDTKKYKRINDSIVDCGLYELVFLLQYPDKPVRKGAKLTMSGWCNKHKIRWFSDPETLVSYVVQNQGGG